MYLGYALRKMARELGLEVKDGVVCGIFKRYAVSMWEGLSGTKTFSISAKFDDKLYEKLDKDFSELEYKYQRLLYIRFMDDTLTAEFSDNPGTMKQFRNCFFDVLSILDQYDIPDADICPKCGLPMYGQGVWSMCEIIGSKICLYAHEHCAAAMEREVNRQLEIGKRTPVSKEQFIKDIKGAYPEESIKEIEKAYKEIEAEQNPGKRYLPGWIGALGGYILSAILFVVLCLMDSGSHYSRGGGLSLVACCGGFIIKKGYDLTKDTYGKKRCFTIIIMTVLYVFLGVLGIAVVQEAMAMNQFNTVPEGISIVEECRLYIHSGIRSVLLDKGRFLIGLIIFTSVSLFIIIVDLYNDGDRDERMRRKRLQKRK